VAQEATVDSIAAAVLEQSARPIRRRCGCWRKGGWWSRGKGCESGRTNGPF